MFKKFMLLNAIGLDGEPSGTGDTPPSGGSAGDVPPPAGDDFKGPEWAKDYLPDLGAEILNDPCLQAIQDPKALVKSYVHAQRALGKKGVNVPNENSTKEEWDTFYQKIGVPLDEKAYEESFKLPDDHVFGDTVADIKKMAHELRIHPSQASKLIEGMNEKIANANKSFVEQNTVKAQEELNALMDSMGEEAYNVKLTKTVSFLKESMPDFFKYVSESGLGKNAQVVKALMEFTDKLTDEGGIPKGTGGYGMTPDQIESEINSIYGDFSDPYHNPSHPNHGSRVKYMNELFKKQENIRARAR